MHTETRGRKTPLRGRLSDITNTAPVSFSKHREDENVSKVCDSQLHKELASLRKALAVKEELIQAQKVNMEKLWTNYNRKTKQNEEIIQQNGCLYKDLMQARNRLKILQHENAQMASAHKVMKSELQAKLAKALEQADFPKKVAGSAASEKVQSSVPNLLAKLAESRARRTVVSCETSNDLSHSVEDEGSEHSATCRSALRRRPSLSYKEPSLKAKLRQPEIDASQVKPGFNHRESPVHRLHIVEEEVNIAPRANACSTDDKLVETSCPSCPPTVRQTESCSLSAVAVDVLEGRSPSSSIVPEESTSGIELNSSEQLPRQMLESSPCSAESSSGRPSRRSSIGVSSYKEAPLNTKLRRSS